MPQFPKPYTPEEDGRFKILPERHEEIKAKSKGGRSLRSLAVEYGVDKGTIKAILDPEWYKTKQAKRYAQKPWATYYQKDEWKETMRKFRAKKRSLNKLNKSKPPCLFCGLSLDPNGKKQKFCSPKCGWDFHNNLKRRS